MIHISALLKDMEMMASAGIKPGAFWLQDAFSNLMATFTHCILAPR